MTEELARTKWCPMVRATAVANHNQQAVTSNSPVEIAASACIASDCMMWRADDPTYTGYPSSTGYCGLAGKL